MLEKGDLAAPTCNDCHGNHGAVPPEVGSVANACGTCHGKVAALFNGTRMKHRYEEVGLPGCATCHGHHGIGEPSDAMLGMESEAVCARCHAEGMYGAPEAGARGARAMRQGLEQLKASITGAEAKVAKAERLGVEVRVSKFDLRKAQDALTNARSLVHGFSLEPVAGAVREGLAVTTSVDANADEALREHGLRRLWLVLSLIPILCMAGLLLLFVRRLPPSAPGP
jgi:predicted CXXCH cytochrome family protein